MLKFNLQLANTEQDTNKSFVSYLDIKKAPFHKLPSSDLDIYISLFYRLLSEPKKNSIIYNYYKYSDFSLKIIKWLKRAAYDKIENLNFLKGVKNHVNRSFVLAINNNLFNTHMISNELIKQVFLNTRNVMLVILQRIRILTSGIVKVTTKSKALRQ